MVNGIPLSRAVADGTVHDDDDDVGHGDRDTMTLEGVCRVFE